MKEREVSTMDIEGIVKEEEVNVMHQEDSKLRMEPFSRLCRLISVGNGVKKPDDVGVKREFVTMTRQEEQMRLFTTTANLRTRLNESRERQNIENRELMTELSDRRAKTALQRTKRAAKVRNQLQTSKKKREDSKMFAAAFISESRYIQDKLTPPKKEEPKPRGESSRLTRERAKTRIQMIKQANTQQTIISKLIEESRPKTIRKNPPHNRTTPKHKISSIEMEDQKDSVEKVTDFAEMGEEERRLFWSILEEIV